MSIVDALDTDNGQNDAELPISSDAERKMDSNDQQL